MKKKKDRFNKIMNILSSNQLMAIYNLLQNIIANKQTDILKMKIKSK